MENHAALGPPNFPCRSATAALRLGRTNERKLLLIVYGQNSVSLQLWLNGRTAAGIKEIARSIIS